VTTHLNASLASVTLGGRSYAHTTAKGCLTCNHPVVAQYSARQSGMRVPS